MPRAGRALTRRPSRRRKRRGLTQALGVHVSNPLSAKLENALTDASGVYIGAGVDPQSFLAGLASNIREHSCAPFPISATVMSPGVPGATIGSTISGECVAHNSGYWLVYQPEQDLFYCFWGTEQSNLGAHGVFGSPLYCWSA